MRCVIELARNIRDRHNKPLKQPMRRVIISHPDAASLASLARPPVCRASIRSAPGECLSGLQSCASAYAVLPSKRFCCTQMTLCHVYECCLLASLACSSHR